MAQFTAQGTMKLLFNGEGSSFRRGSKDPFRFRLGSVHVRKRRLRFFDSSAERGSWRRNARAHARSANKHSKEGVHGEDDEYDDEFGVDDELACFRGLVLDLSYRPVNVVCWRRAICLEFMEKVPHLLQVVKRRRVKNNLSRKNLLYRDSYTCQYCSSGENLTIDHVLPISRGGEWTWENLVTACAKCNSKKGHKTIEEANMKLLKIPKAPKDFDILAIPLTSAAVKMLRVRKGTPEEWRQYLGRSSSER
ncbi:uncharacterized protein LOC115730482 isoform X2 [Rhodamnia argentea]|uniref:Uncharacterized protein LOC115730482 isoform X2 n=1 Tax=Rhodamnia argentea TaxID=178133 RepID=A0A8B8N3M2_9MYRT|nr:uncharacterized protein LOC115730482 isoform X2 [Rhodamnia argentea]